MTRIVGSVPNRVPNERSTRTIRKEKSRWTSGLRMARPGLEPGTPRFSVVDQDSSNTRGTPAFERVLASPSHRLNVRKLRSFRADLGTEMCFGARGSLARVASPRSVDPFRSCTSVQIVSSRGRCGRLDDLEVAATRGGTVWSRARRHRDRDGPGSACESALVLAEGVDAVDDVDAEGEDRERPPGVGAADRQQRRDRAQACGGEPDDAAIRVAGEE